jgi:hypothetical protein
VADRLYILDLDRTLFDTGRFFNDVLAALKRTHNLDLEQSRATMAEFIDPENGGYDPHSHHERLLGITADELDHIVTHELGRKDYMFTDATAWLTAKRREEGTDFVILTVGRPRYQKLKLEHAPAAQDLPMVVLPSAKATYIKEHYLNTGAKEVTFIDDSADVFQGLTQAGSLMLVRIARPGEKYSDQPCPPDIRQISNFGELS